MARRPTERPATEHIATLTRVVNQVSVSSLRKTRKTTIIRKLGEVIALFQKELTK